MSSFQSITIVGNVGRTPEMRYTQGGDAVTSVNLAVNERITARDGQTRENVTWFKVTFWGKLAETIAQYTKEGDSLLVVGKVKSPTIYTDKNGNPAVSLEVKADNFTFLGSKNGKPAAGNEGTATAPMGTAPSSEDEIPF